MGIFFFLSKETNGLTILSRWEYFQSLQVEWALVCVRLAIRPSLVSAVAISYSV